MLYLEDFLEMIENLPMEMRDRFTEMREMDLEVQNNMDSLDERVKTLFKKCQTGNAKKDWKDEQFEKIKTEYKKTLEQADDKVQLANQLYDLVDRHLRRLDQELSKFKMELEADNAGITEVLEKRSLELDQQQTLNHKAEKRKYTHSGISNHVEKKLATEKNISLPEEVARVPFGTNRQPVSNTSSPATAMFNSTTSNSKPQISGYNIGKLPVGSAIAQAASQAIAATQQMQQGRRTASLKASFEEIRKNSDLQSAFNVATANTSSLGDSGRSQRQKKTTQRAQAYLQQQHNKHHQHLQQALQTAPTTTQALPVTPTVVEELIECEPVPVDATSTNPDWTYDPNEPRYCTCNEVSYGEMVGCDNDDCPIEWFHYGCVGLTQAPKGKWYCQECHAAMKRRGRK